MTQPNQHRPITEERLAEARALFADGASQMEVARTTGIDRNTLLKYLPRELTRGWSYTESGKFSRELYRARKKGLV